MISNEDTLVENKNNNKQKTINNKIENNNNLNISKNAISTDIASTKNTNPQQQQSQLDIERENHLSQIITLYSKGLTQSEIAEKMKVNQLLVMTYNIYSKKLKEYLEISQ